MRAGDRWLAFARLTVPRGHVLSGRSEELTNAHVAAEVRVLAKQWLAHARSADLPVYKGIGLVLSYPGMPYDEVTSTLDWALALREEAGFRRRHEYHAAWKPLVAQLNDADLLRYAAVGGKLFDDVLRTAAGRRPGLADQAALLGWSALARQMDDVLDLQLPPAERAAALLDIAVWVMTAQRLQAGADQSLP